ncbi:MAG: DinB family protein [Candidatus Hodarchaeales archaeon]
MRLFSKDDIIKGIMSERKIFEELTLNLSEKQMEIFDVSDKWSVKNIIGHIAYWDVQGTKWITDIVEGKKPDIIWAKESSIKGVREKQAEINNIVHKEIQKKSLTLILEEFKQSYNLLIETIEKLTEEQMQQNFNFNYTEETVSTKEIVNWRKNHYNSHIKQLGKIISQLK